MDTLALISELAPLYNDAERKLKLVERAIALLKLPTQDVFFIAIVRHYNHGKKEKTRATHSNLIELLDSLKGKVVLPSPPSGSRYYDDEVLVCVGSLKFPQTVVLLDHTFVGIQHPDIDTTVWRAIPHTKTAAYESIDDLLENPAVSYPDPS